MWRCASVAVTVHEYETADGKVPFRDWLATLLVGGSKGTQAKDIRRAQASWRDYLGEK